MKYIEKLLNGAEVKWMPLGEVFETRNGYTPSKANNDFWTNGDIPWFRMEDIRDSGRLLNDSIQHITPQAIKGKGLFRANSIIMATTATIGEHALLLVDALANQRFTNFQIRKSLSERISPMFAFYYFFVLGEWCKSNVNTSSFPSVDMARLMKQLFPIPPLAVQEEIVRILDKFTTLEAELEAELDCRKRQYEYYRNQLLSFDMLTRGGQKLNNVSWLTLGEVFETRNGYTPSKANAAFWENGTIPWFRMEDIRANGGVLKDSIQHVTPQAIKGKGLFMAGSIIMATTATIGEHALITVDALANQQFTNFRVRNSMEDKLLTKFVYYYFFVIDEWCKQNVNVSSFPSVEIERLKKQPFPIPSLAEQQRIVSILDKFEALTTSISEGLPKEIELRRKQYEYYRNQLLSFA